MTSHMSQQVRFDSMEFAYLGLLRTLLTRGQKHDDRTGTGTYRIFGYQMRCNLMHGFPLLTTKKMWWRGIVEELLWMLSGSTNAKDLQARGVTIWDEWATKEQCARFGREEGDLGPVYGHQWRNFGASYDGRGTVWATKGFDQIADVIDKLLHNPNSRRIILTGWNPKEADKVALPPCHTLTQFSVHKGRLSAHLYQRSADAFLGVPFNIASYALLTELLAYVCGLGLGDFVHTFGDVHIYKNHVQQVRMQLDRDQRPPPILNINHSRAVSGHSGTNTALAQLLDIKFSDLELGDYRPHPAIKAEVSV